MKRLKKVQAAGKNLHVTIAPEEVEQDLSMLSARGLFIQTWTKTQAQAEELLEQAERWSMDRGRNRCSELLTWRNRIRHHFVDKAQISAWIFDFGFVETPREKSRRFV